MLSLVLAMATTQDKPERAMDFWAGEWATTGRMRTAPGKDEWTETKAENTIRWIHSEKVLHENFSMGTFSGESWTVFNAQSGKFQQTWVDSGGSYLLFEGGKVGDTVVLNQTNSPNAEMRMVFRDIKREGFVWDWQMKVQGEWETQWQLNYKRK